jgi:transposase
VRLLVDGVVRELIETFGTTTRDLLALRDWLSAHEVTHVAMESTGVYWKCVYYVLEDDFELLLVNAQHIKHVPGRKTDTIDAAWIAQLLACGLLKGSLVPPPDPRAQGPDALSQGAHLRARPSGQSPAQAA